ncbi:unnamed protein product [Rhizophagus irregularis]|nr:unnamed protein product [Rhizophagus irregularis]CAB4445029.1 unnamed protein product [Rhizophagus irregularis]
MKEEKEGGRKGKEGKERKRREEGKKGGKEQKKRERREGGYERKRERRRKERRKRTKKGEKKRERKQRKELRFTHKKNRFFVIRIISCQHSYAVTLIDDDLKKAISKLGNMSTMRKFLLERLNSLSILFATLRVMMRVVNLIFCLL